MSLYWPTKKITLISVTMPVPFSVCIRSVETENSLKFTPSHSVLEKQKTCCCHNFSVASKYTLISHRSFDKIMKMCGIKLFVTNFTNNNHICKSNNIQIEDLISLKMLRLHYFSDKHSLSVIISTLKIAMRFSITQDVMDRITLRNYLWKSCKLITWKLSEAPTLKKALLKCYTLLL